jgi:hypothetical protein
LLAFLQGFQLLLLILKLHRFRGPQHGFLICSQTLISLLFLSPQVRIYVILLDITHITLSKWVIGQVLLIKWLNWLAFFSLELLHQLGRHWMSLIFVIGGEWATLVLAMPLSFMDFDIQASR